MRYAAGWGVIPVRQYTSNKTLMQCAHIITSLELVKNPQVTCIVIFRCSVKLTTYLEVKSQYYTVTRCYLERSVISRKSSSADAVICHNSPVILFWDVSLSPAVKVVGVLVIKCPCKHDIPTENPQLCRIRL